jgi:hypothetical protein
MDLIPAHAFAPESWRPLNVPGTLCGQFSISDKPTVCVCQRGLDSGVRPRLPIQRAQPVTDRLRTANRTRPPRRRDLSRHECFRQPAESSVDASTSSSDSSSDTKQKLRLGGNPSMPSRSYMGGSEPPTFGV